MYENSLRTKSQSGSWRAGKENLILRKIKVYWTAAQLNRDTAAETTTPVRTATKKAAPEKSAKKYELHKTGAYIPGTIMAVKVVQKVADPTVVTVKYKPETKSGNKGIQEQIEEQDVRNLLTNEWYFDN